MPKKLVLSFLFLLLMTAVFAACAPTQTEAEALQVSGAWVRPADVMSAAYLQITNNGRSPQQLVGVETAVAESAEIHETQMDGDLMKMRPVEAVQIPAGETVQLKPGGEHIMLMGLSAPLVASDTIMLTLTFDSGATLEVEAVVSLEPVEGTDALTTASLLAAADGVFVGQVTNPPVRVQDFSAPSTRPDVAALSDLNGRWRLIFFGYMHCPDFCPLTLVDYKNAKAVMGEAAEEVNFVFISVDADRDTVALMQPYLANFDLDFVGFAADDATLARIQPDYGFYYERRLGSGPEAVYTIDHSTRSYLLDREGVLRATFAYDTDPELMAAALQWYLAHE
ncbi:MAG: copper chaperone PCu(A)C [Anaerolineae bacterium]|nr:copper chaperone PCu(A)C [Anaerolineae bacterium]